MRIISNDKLIQRNKKISQFLTGGSLLILAAGLVISFSKPELFLVSWGSLILGFLLSQLGIYFTNRWGRSPRPDEVISTSLKGLDDRFTLYHYASPVPHLLIAPNCLWAILPYAQKGRVVYDGKKYKHTGGNAILKFFGQEGIGRPDQEAVNQIKEIQKSLQPVFGEDEVPPIDAIVVFTNDSISLEVEDAPVSSVSAKKLKEMIRKRVKDYTITAGQIEKIQEKYR